MPTPLGLVRGLGSGKTGTDVFIRERISGLLLFFLVPYLMIALIPVFGEPYPVVLERIGSLWVGPPLIAFLLINATHMAMGMRVIIEDYVHARMLKYALLILNWAFSWGCALIAALAVIRIMFLVVRI
ncbi:succinate dehydrogenase, hydrophobic membrane anchor protein (plasmid) [Peteryoungia desertarenae]|uniref:Succinate dehydrogenase hydrophobic membrane anchor subunit n=1 Tax=Peteryoungia desertarenae TaxID=1813451 RepID=A0ABX6QTG1_9HYPH|nr:succinate dehydrogenase, hydrophobic membrane anchor protein [Peteryoungia desertarenae]QLF71936.1 succinate dehydrogenase, hydrophobic membrane anchor protein [Peteryoungia desertarenae]